MSEGEIERFLNASREDDSDGDARVSAELTISKGWKGLDFARKPRTVRVPQTPLWSALIETGARWSELTNTTWNDLDVERRALTLRAETTKSGRSRMVPLRSEMVETLLALRAVHQQRHKRITRSTDRIFLSPEGSDWRRDTAGVRRILHRILERAGIDRRDEQGKCVDIHALRHTAASRMAARGVPITIAQKVLGHSDPKLTAAVYTHLEVEDLRVAVDERPTKSTPAMEQSA
ncbi:MAG: site-specific integrase [Sandaracinaceae bacterium]|nr:site-specific integrase [Sandaracinaceae bacterium]